MPTALKADGFRFYFFSHEPDEPMHVHVDRDKASAKYWLEPVALARNAGFAPLELRQIERLIRRNRRKLIEAWNGHFGA